MRKPILIFKFPFITDEEQKKHISEKIDEKIPIEEYHRLVFFGDYKEPTIELLQKGRHHKTIKNLSKLLK